MLCSKLGALFTSELGVETILNVSHKFKSRSVGRARHCFAAGDTHGEVLSHGAIFDGLNNGGFQLNAEVSEGSILVELSSLGEASGPGVDRGDGVGRGLLTLLVFTEMSSDSAVSGLSLN